MTRTPEAVTHADAILDRLRACTTLEKVNATAGEIAPGVKAMAENDPFILNDARGLVGWMRRGLSEGWLPLKKNEPAEGVTPKAGSNRNADVGGQANG